MITKIKSFALVLLCLAGRQAAAQPLTLDLHAPRVVNTGEAFRITFVTNQSVENFTPPSIEGFTILAGPVQSTSQSVNIVNGNVSRTMHVSFTYTLFAENEGTFAIGAAKVRAGNAEAQTQIFNIECVSGTAKAQQNQPAQQSAGSKASNAGKDLFLDIEVSKREVYRGESLSAAIKLYARNTSIAGIENPKMPNFNGFWKQDIETPQQINFQRENVNGTVYDAGLLFSQLLFPQQTGEIVISPAELDVIAQMRTRPRDFFDDFFGGGVQNVRRPLKSNAVTIRVKDLPQGAPAGFAGAVGNFRVESSISAGKVTANNAVTLTVKISGSGNLELLNAPKIAFPPDFETYEVKGTKNVKNSTSGAAGVRQFEYPVIPRSAGEFEIPAIEFSYFNPASGQYHTLRTQAHRLLVERDARAGDTYIAGEPHRSDVKHLGRDIRFINTSAAGWLPQPALFVGTPAFYLCYLFLAALFAVAWRLLQKRLRYMQNVALVKNRRANKIARKRLSIAAHLLKMGKSQEFYEELLRAVWEYLSSKLNIPVAELSRSAVQEALSERQAGNAEIGAFLSIVDECEFARYSPSGGQQAMEHLYNTAAQAISKLEQQIH